VSASAETGAQAEYGTARHAAAASFFGGVIENYDFFIYGAASALVLNDVFFPTFDDTTGTLLSLGTFGIAFLARPVGGILFGHVGDRLGRRGNLIATLLLMGAATFLIGCLPTYGSIGVAAPLLLVVLRLVQGVAAGGELGGAAALAIEHAPPQRRGFFGSFSVAGNSAGISLGAGVFSLVELMPSDTLHAWAWRVPFWASAVIVVVGYLVRRTVPETEDFELAKANDERARFPLWTVITRHPGPLVVAVTVFAAQILCFYLVTVYSLTYVDQIGAGTSSTILHALTLGTLVNVCAFVFWGFLSDIVGRRRILGFGLISQSVTFSLFYVALGHDSFWLIAGTMILTLGFGQAAIVGTAPAFFGEMFGRDVRVTGISMGMQLASILGGFAPAIAGALVAGGRTWHVLSAAVAIVSAAALLAVCVGGIRPRRAGARRRLDQVPAPL
jgi:MFS transporter, MHS family, shikimate and dehydroshikimate transport protein